MKLKPCPFCASNRLREPNRIEPYAECMQCGVFGPSPPPKDNRQVEITLAMAMDLWNTRGNVAMSTYIIREVGDARSHRDGQSVEAKDLSAAKRVASRNQMFQRTVLKIEAENGTVLSVKENDKWTDR